MQRRFPHQPLDSEPYTVSEYFTVFIRGTRPGHQDHATRILVLLKGDTAGQGEFINSFAANKPQQHPQALPSTTVSLWNKLSF